MIEQKPAICPLLQDCYHPEILKTNLCSFMNCFSSCITRSYNTEEIALCPILHTWAHTHPQLPVMPSLTPRKHGQFWSPDSWHRWLWHCWDMNLWSPDNRTNVLPFGSQKYRHSWRNILNLFLNLFFKVLARNPLRDIAHGCISWQKKNPDWQRN